MAGRVVHFEIPYDDGDRARSFYERAFGWQLMPMPEMATRWSCPGQAGTRARPSPVSSTGA